MIYHFVMQTSIRPKAQEALPDEGHSLPPVKTESLPLPLLILKAMRPKQWTKNVLLFAGLLFALQFTHWDSIWRAFAGFGLFCLFSSSVYLINDVRDRDKDRLNPRTMNRPIASGALKPSIAIAAVAIIL